MNRLIVASKQPMRATFSHRQMKCPSATISRFLCTGGKKTLYSWPQPMTPLTLLDHLPQSKNQERELHEQKQLQNDISLDVEFAELGEAVTSPPKTNFRLWQEHPREKKGESLVRALRAGEVTVGSNTQRRNDINNPHLLRVRIKKVDPEMSMSAIYRMFSSYGNVSGLVSTKNDAIDVFFHVNGEVEAERLLSKLDRNLITEVGLVQKKTTGNSTCENSELHFEKLIGGLRKQLELQHIYLQDLEHLHSAVSHLKAYPYPISSNS